MKGTSKAVEAPVRDFAKSAQSRTGEGLAQDLFDKQKAYFATDRRSRKLRNRKLLRQVWVRFPHTCEVNSRFPT
jgi:hypothetical protein